LVEINVSGEPGKGGVQPGELASVLPQLAGLDHLRLRGLMTMAPLSEDAESARPVFARLRALRGECARLAPGPDLRHLSMGMTQDFEIAIEEGADMIRVGTARFRED
jgi:uncharacterized pyridoxal phosphate-containing UPF0001 family protein